MDTEIAQVIWLENLGRPAWRRLHFKRMFRVRAFDVCLTPNSGARADIPGLPLRATKKRSRLTKASQPNTRRSVSPYGELNMVAPLDKGAQLEVCRVGRDRDGPAPDPGSRHFPERGEH